MKLGNTIANKIAEQDPEAFTLLQKIINRPAMFVGTNRFDYIDCLLTGYYIGRGTGVDFLPNKEMQYWLLHKQSATLHGSISGRQLFYRCFGYKNLALENYKAFLYADLTQIPQHFKGIDYEIYAHEENQNIVRYEWEEDIPSDYYEKLAQAVLNSINCMISQSGFVYDLLKIYIRRESLFCQARFMFHDTDGWKDDNEIIVKQENHEYLIALHTNARNARKEDLQNYGCDVVDVQDYDDKLLTLNDSFIDKITYSSEYLRWKNDVLTSSHDLK